MAPRKRTTNAKNNRKKDPKMQKFEAFLVDFDDEVRTIIERLKENTSNLLKDADNMFNLALIKLPLTVRQMNWIQYSASENTPTPVDESKQKEEATTEAEVELIKAQDYRIPPKSAKKAGKTKANSEDGENIVPKSTRKGRPKKAPATSKKGKELSVNKQNTTRKSKKPLVTPARDFLNSSLMGPTPLITPRFDSRLPKTPAMRVARHREKVYSISVNGSPIIGGTEDVFINVPLGNGECLQLLASEMDSVDLSHLDDKAARSIRQLQNRLTVLCGIPE